MGGKIQTSEFVLESKMRKIERLVIDVRSIPGVALDTVMAGAGPGRGLWARGQGTKRKRDTNRRMSFIGDASLNGVLIDCSKCARTCVCVCVCVCVWLAVCT